MSSDQTCPQKGFVTCQLSLTKLSVDSITVSIFVDVLVELTNTVFVNSTTISTNIETALLFSYQMLETDFHPQLLPQDVQYC